MKLNRRKFIGTAAAGGALATIWPKKALSLGAELEQPPLMIVIHCDGGWDPTLVFDNKISSSYIDTQSGCSSATGAGGISYVHHSSRPAVKTFFDQYGASTAIVNGLYCGDLSHKNARKYSDGTLVPDNKRYTDWMSFYGAQTGLSTSIPHLIIDSKQIPGIYAEYTSRITTESIIEYGNATLSGTDALASEAETALTTFLNSKYSKILDDRINSSLDSEKLQAIQGGYIHEASIKKAIEEFSADAGKSDFSNNLMLAGHFLDNGYSQCITIQAGKSMQWDTHNNNDSEQSTNFEMLFSGINDLLAAIDSGSLTNLSNNLTIVVKSELGRSPKKNSTGKNGKSHWPFTSTMLWGTGINGGNIFGKTDDRLRGLPINPIFGAINDSGSVPLEMTNVFAALYNLFGIPSTLLMPDVIPASMLLAIE